MSNTMRDVWGIMEIDDRGYAHRGPEYAERAAVVERVSGIESPWRANRDGSFSSTYPVWSKAHKMLTARSAAKLASTVSLGALPDGRPEFLKDYTLVVGVLPSAPLDLATRFDHIIAALKQSGWNVAVKKIGTDFEGPLGIPIMKLQPLELWMHRTDRTYTAIEAQAALVNALAHETIAYNPVSATLSEYWREVVVPSAQDATKVGQKGLEWLPWVIGGAVVLVVASTARDMTRIFR